MRSIPGFYPLDASNTLPNLTVKIVSWHCQICPVGQSHPWLWMTGLGHYVANSFCSWSNLVLSLISQLFSFVLKVYLSIVFYSAYELFILVSKYTLFLSFHFSTHFIGNLTISSVIWNLFLTEHKQLHLFSSLILNINKDKKWQVYLWNTPWKVAPNWQCITDNCPLNATLVSVIYFFNAPI